MTIQTSPLREQILQKRKKRNRKILLFLLMGAVLLAAVITAVVLLVNQPKPEQQPTGPWLKEIRPTQAGGAYSYQVTGGITAEQAQCPLPCYTFIPPAGYNQVLNAQEDANALSYHYTDLYSTLGKEDLFGGIAKTLPPFGERTISIGLSSAMSEQKKFRKTASALSSSLPWME